MAASESEALFPAKVLVVGDLPLVGSLIAKEFKDEVENRQVAFLFAGNGFEAIETLEQDLEIGVVVTAAQMPVMDGLTLLANMNEQNRLYQTAIVTSGEDVQAIRAAMRLGASDFIVQPLDSNDFKITLQRLLNQFFVLKQGMIARKKIIDVAGDLKAAKKIQQSFIPGNFHPLGSNDNFSIFGKMMPAKELGGDFFDFFRISDEAFGLVIGDVSGKGIPAALFMATCRAFIRAIASLPANGKKPTKTCVEKVNELLCETNDSSMFASTFCACFDASNGIFCYTNAGHQGAYVISSNGRLEKVGEGEGIVLGVYNPLKLHEKALYEEKTYQMRDHDTLVLYTDGITEAVNKEGVFYGQGRFEEMLKKTARLPLNQIIDAIKEDVLKFTSPLEQNDDITLLLIRYHPKKHLL